MSMTVDPDVTLDTNEPVPEPVLTKAIEFKTASGTTYRLTRYGEAEWWVERLGDVPLKHYYTLEDFPNDTDKQRVYFYYEPQVGVSFRYDTSRWGGCLSTPVTEINLVTELLDGGTAIVPGA